MEILSKQKLRTQETQKRLLDAAEEVFVREGFEAAQLDTIAANAGRSKGAVYTHFKSKEDLFIALFEHRTSGIIDTLTGALRECTSREQSFEVFRKFYLDLVQDKIWPILTLEFKLFALRHPESKERLRSAFEISKAMAGADEKQFEQMFGKLNAREREDTDLSIASLGPILSGLILESYFEPKVLSEKGLERILARIFDAFFPREIEVSRTGRPIQRGRT